MKFSIQNAVLTMILALLAACQGGPDSQQPAAGQEEKKAAPKAHLVEVETIQSSLAGISNQWHGSLAFSEQVNIYNQEKGRLEVFPFREGDRIKRGELLMSMDDRLLRAEKTRLQAQIAQAKTDWNRIKRLVNKQAISAEELDKANTQLAILDAEQKLLDIRLGYFQIHAPFAGIVTARLVNPGDAVAAQTHLLTVSKIDSLTARVQVAEAALPTLKMDMPATIIVPASGDAYPGKVVRIYPQLHPTTRQATVEIAFNKTQEGLYAGQSVLARISSAQRPRILAPLEALKRDGQGEHVFLMKDGKAYRQAVVSGNYLGGKVEITDGLKAGDQVVTRGFLGLKSGKAVKVAGDQSATEKPPENTVQGQKAHTAGQSGS